MYDLLIESKRDHTDNGFYTVATFKAAQDEMRIWGDDYRVAIMRNQDALIIAGNNHFPGAGNHQSAWD